MRGALSSTIAAIRAYRRVAAQTKPTRSAEHDLAGVGVHPTAGVVQFAGDLFKSPRRRSVIAMAAAVTLAVAGLAAACLGAASLNEGSHSGQPRTVLEPYGTVPAATSSTASTKTTANDQAPTTSPLSAIGAAGGPGPGATQAAAGSTSGAGTGAGTGTQTTAVPAPSPSAAAPTASPTLLDLCRSVVAAGNGWPSVLKTADRATVTAAAGTKKNVLPYCTNLVANDS